MVKLSRTALVIAHPQRFGTCGRHPGRAQSSRTRSSPPSFYRPAMSDLSLRSSRDATSLHRKREAHRGPVCSVGYFWGHQSIPLSKQSPGCAAHRGSSIPPLGVALQPREILSCLKVPASTSGGTFQSASLKGTTAEPCKGLIGGTGNGTEQCTPRAGSDLACRVRANARPSGHGELLRSGCSLVRKQGWEGGAR